MTTGRTAATTRQARSAESFSVLVEVGGILADVARRARLAVRRSLVGGGIDPDAVGRSGFPFESLILVGVYLPLSLMTAMLTLPALPAPAATTERPRLQLQIGLIRCSWCSPAGVASCSIRRHGWIDPLVGAAGRRARAPRPHLVWRRNVCHEPGDLQSDAAHRPAPGRAPLRSLGFGRGYRKGRLAQEPHLRDRPTPNGPISPEPITVLSLEAACMPVRRLSPKEPLTVRTT